MIDGVRRTSKSFGGGRVRSDESAFRIAQSDSKIEAPLAIDFRHSEPAVVPVKKICKFLRVRVKEYVQIQDPVGGLLIVGAIRHIHSSTGISFAI